MSMGVVYIANGRKYIDEAFQSATSLKDKMPSMHTTIFSTEDVKAHCFDRIVVIQDSQNGYLDKVLCMSYSPYDYTLFLDTDTYVCSDFSELFTLLEKYDIGASLAPLRGGINSQGEVCSYQNRKDINGRFIFPIINTGVILYKKSSRVSKFLSDWLALCKQQMNEKGKSYTDQPAFHETLSKSNVREVILTPEYNCRFIFPVCVSGIVKILHGRHPNLPAVAREINSDLRCRLFHPNWGLTGQKRLYSKLRYMMLYGQRVGLHTHIMN